MLMRKRKLLLFKIPMLLILVSFLLGSFNAIAQSSENEILDITVPNLVEPLDWDDYGRRVEGMLMFDSTENILPIISVSPLATITGNTEFNMPADGDTTIVYVVTAEDGTTANWELILTIEAPSTKAEFEIFNIKNVFVDEDGDDAVYFMEDNRILVAASDEADITKIHLILDVSFGATIEPTTVSGTIADFTTVPKMYTITAQDTSVHVEYPISIYKEETVAPMVVMGDSTYNNYMDSVMVNVTDASLILGGGGVALFNKDFDIANGDMDDAFDDMMASGVELVMGSTEGAYYVPTNDLVPGIYYAYAQDFFGNLSVASVDSVVIAVDTVVVDALADMEVLDNVIYKFTGNALVAYTTSSRHQKWINDGSMGLLIDDSKEYIDDTVVMGDIITNLYGTLDDYFGLLQFKPIALSADSTMIVSRENEVVPVEVSFEDLMDDKDTYQSQLVKITNVLFDDADGVEVFVKNNKLDITEATTGETSLFRTSFSGADYIGELIPEDAQDIVGLVGYNWNDIVFTARDLNDFTEVEGYEFNIDPEEYNFELVGLTEDVKEFTITNGRADILNVEFIYIEGNTAFRVDLLENIEVLGYEDYDFNVNFKPKEFGTYEATLFVELADGTTHEVALTGDYSDFPDEPVMQLPYSSNFNDEAANLGWTLFNDGAGVGFLNLDLPWNTSPNWARVGGNGYPGGDDAYLVSPPIDFSSAKFPVVEFNNLWNSDSDVTNYYLVASNDGKKTWDVVFEITESGSKIYSIDVSDYVGDDMVYFAFNIKEPTTAGFESAAWWELDDFVVKEQPTFPVFALNQDMVDFGVVDGSTTEALSISNDGISYFTVSSITLGSSSDIFTLVDVPTENVDVYGEALTVGVAFDGTVGMHIDTVIVVYIDPREGAMTVKVPVAATGVSCAAPMVAALGDNTAPYAPSWFSFTPTNDALITISSCGDVVDTDVEVYKGCDGILVAANDDSGCPNYASTVVFPAEGGVTYMINWVSTWSADGFTFTIASEDLATAPVLLTAEASAVNATTGMVALTFEDMIQLIPAKKDADRNVYSESAINKYLTKYEKGSVNITSSAAKTFVPDGTPEVEPNGDELTAEVHPMGTTDAPTKVTGHFGVGTDQDWFKVATADIGFYLDITLEVEDGVCNLLWVYPTETGWSGWSEEATPGSPASFNWTQFTNDVDTMYIWVRRGAMNAVEEPGYGWNLKYWSSAPPSFSIYRDNLKVAGPQSMAFSYIDQGINLDQEYCYAVTQQLYDGSESELSNSICVTAKAGTGDICTKSVEVGPGLNTAPKSPYWYAYTPTASKMVTISSNIEENGDPSEDWNDTMLDIYANCDDDSPMYSNDDVDPGRLSELSFAVEAGETYLIHWRRWAADGEVNAYDSEPFFFTIVEEDMLAGDFVETAIPVMLPMVDMAGTTLGFNHDYDATACDYIFMEGNDVCYSFSVPYGGTITGGIEGAYAGMHVIKGKPGSDACVVFAGGSTGGTFTDQVIDPGEYFIIVSTKLPSNEIDFVMDLEFTAAAKQMVTFNVDMSTQISLGNFNPATDTVDVVGSFNLWERTADMADTDGDGVYTYALPTEFFVGDVLKYKYRINGDWDKAEFSSDIYGSREWTVLTADNVTDDLFNDEATPTFDVTFKVVMTRQIELGNFDAAANKVGLNASTGDVAELMDADGTFTYATTVTADYGVDITYNFNIDGTAEEVTDRTTGAIMENTVIAVWYNNDDAVNVTTDLAENVSVYPNPATTDFTVDFGTANTENTTAQLVDLNGQVIKSIEINNRALINIDVAEYAKGVYYLKITNGESVSIQKVVVQ